MSLIYNLFAITLFAPIINNMVAYSLLAPENTYLDQKMVYTAMDDNVQLKQAIIDVVPAADEFYTINKTSNIGKLKEVNDLMANRDFANAETINNGITAENAIQADRKTVNGVYMQTWAKDRYEFTANEYLTLREIADKRPVVYGDAVYSARVMLGEEGTNTSSLKQVNPANPTNTYIGKAYPNPANNEVNLNYKLDEGQKASLEVFNLMGQLIEKVELNSDKTTIIINTNKFVEGLYLFKVVLNGEIISNDKIIIVK